MGRGFASVRAICRLTRIVGGVALALAAAAGMAAVLNNGVAVAAPTSRTWTVESSADVSPTSVDILNSISCPTAGFCAAVGATGTGVNTRPFIEIEKGHIWSISPLADTTPPTLSVLDSISCASARFCMAVGAADSSGPEGAFIKVPAAETWNGKVWTLIDVPANPPASGFEIRDELTGVSCPTSTFCAATVVTAGVTYVGNEPTSVDKGYAEIWNGSTWTTQVIGAQPLAVSCVSSSSCAAVGTEGGSQGGLLTLGGAAFVSNFDGSNWSDTDLRLPASTGGILSGATLDAVSCSGKSCLATGTQTLVSGHRGIYHSRPTTVIDASWSGSRWSTKAVPVPVSPLNGLACVATGTCVGVGSCTTAICGGAGAPMIAQLESGLWSYAPDPISARPGTLNSVSCGSRQRCTAAGDQLVPSSRSLVVTGSAKPPG